MGIFWGAVLVDVDVFAEGISFNNNKKYHCFFLGGDVKSCLLLAQVFHHDCVKSEGDKEQKQDCKA